MAGISNNVEFLQH